MLNPKAEGSDSRPGAFFAEDEILSFQRVMLKSLGLSAGLFDALSRESMSCVSLSKRLNMDPEAVDVYCKCALLHGVLERDGKKLKLPDDVKEIFFSGKYHYDTSYMLLGAWARHLPLYLEALRGGRYPLCSFAKRLIRRAVKRIASQHEWNILERTVPSLSQKCRILDLGCGDGYYLTEFVKRNSGSTGLGIDIECEAIEEAKTRCLEFGLENRVRFEHTSIEEFSNKQPSFDVVLVMGLLHYLDSPSRKKIVELARRVLQDKGYLIIRERVYPDDDQTMQPAKSIRPALMPLIMHMSYGTRLLTSSEIHELLSDFSKIQELDVTPEGTVKLFIACREVDNA